MSRSERMQMVSRDEVLSLSAQCRLLNLSRSSLYYRPKRESAETLALMREIDELFLRYPFYGSRKFVHHLRREGNSSPPAPGASADAPDGEPGDLPGAEDQQAAPRPQDLPVLAQRLRIERPDLVWCADITYIPVRSGFLYLVAVMDWASRRVLSWRQIPGEISGLNYCA